MGFRKTAKLSWMEPEQDITGRQTGWDFEVLSVWYGIPCRDIHIRNKCCQSWELDLVWGAAGRSPIVNRQSTEWNGTERGVNGFWFALFFSLF